LLTVSLRLYVSADFIIGLLSFRNHTIILVVVDRFSETVHFGTLSSNFTASQVAGLFACMICKLHGMPKRILSYRDPIFMSHFWQELFKLSGTKLHMITPYHPQGDGQTEVVNRILQQYLSAFVHHQPSQCMSFVCYFNLFIILMIYLNVRRDNIILEL